MAFFHFNTLRKYTGALIHLFSNLEIQTIQSNGKPLYSIVPIQYANRERFDIYSQLSYNQMFNGNTQVLPRGILLFTGMNANINRAKNKFAKIYRKSQIIKGETKKLNYQFNSVPYDFTYQVIIQCRGMNEASMILEQVASYFNPSYCLRIKEVDLPDFGDTSCILELNSTSVDQESMDELSTNIVTCTFDLTLRGNIYPAIKEQHLIELVQLFMSTDLPESTEANPVATRVYSEGSKETESGIQTFINQYKAVIKDIEFNQDYLLCKIDSECEKLIKFKFNWWVNDIKQDSEIEKLHYAPRDGDIVKVQAFTDIVESDIFEKEFYSDEPRYDLIINDLIRDEKFLECDFTDSNLSNIKYTFEWFINGKKLDLTQRIIKYKSKVSFDCECIIRSSDGREAKYFKHFHNNEMIFKDSFKIKDSMKLELKTDLKSIAIGYNDSMGFDTNNDSNDN
ncbi:hypothetical protein BJL57_08930 [Campylobacter jejuni]|nr:hypothetical protein [Campylobacter jejuni]